MSKSIIFSPPVFQWLEQGDFIDVAGQRIFFRDSGGDKPVILLIHGFPTSSWDWYKIWPLLSKDFRLVAPDMLGFGFSDKPARHPYSIMEQADIIEAVVEKLGLTRFHVLAHDYGDTVAQELLYRQNTGAGQGHWLSVCLLNGGLFPETHRARLAQRLLLSRLGELMCRLLGKKSFEQTMRSIFGKRTQPSGEEIDGFWDLICHNDGNLKLYLTIGYMNDRLVHRSRWLLALQDSCVPVAIINGSADPVSGAHMVNRYRQLVRPRDFIVEMADIGHYPQVEVPGWLASSYLKFQASLKVRA